MKNMFCTEEFLKLPDNLGAQSTMAMYLEMY